MSPAASNKRIGVLSTLRWTLDQAADFHNTQQCEKKLVRNLHVQTTRKHTLPSLIFLLVVIRLQRWWRSLIEAILTAVINFFSLLYLSIPLWCEGSQVAQRKPWLFSSCSASVWAFDSSRRSQNQAYWWKHISIAAHVCVWLCFHSVRCPYEGSLLKMIASFSCCSRGPYQHLCCSSLPLPGCTCNLRHKGDRRRLADKCQRSLWMYKV